MLRRDITPEEFVEAVMWAADCWSAVGAGGEQEIKQRSMDRRVRALFETEEEATPPAGSEEDLLVNTIKGLRHYVDTFTCPAEFESDTDTIVSEVVALRADFATLNEVAKANGALARSLRADLERVTGERERLRGDAEAVRALMDLYNLGGWTDAVAPMKRALAAEADLKAATEALDKWAPLLDGENKPLAERIRNEGEDFRMLCDHLSSTYGHFSGGRITKPNTLPSEVFAVAEDIQMRDFKEWMQDDAARTAGEGRDG